MTKSEWEEVYNMLGVFALGTMLFFVGLMFVGIMSHQFNAPTWLCGWALLPGATLQGIALLLFGDFVWKKFYRWR